MGHSDCSAMAGRRKAACNIIVQAFLMEILIAFSASPFSWCELTTYIEIPCARLVSSCMNSRDLQTSLSVWKVSILIPYTFKCSIASSCSSCPLIHFTCLLAKDYQNNKEPNLGSPDDAESPSNTFLLLVTLKGFGLLCKSNFQFLDRLWATAKPL